MDDHDQVLPEGPRLGRRSLLRGGLLVGAGAVGGGLIGGFTGHAVVAMPYAVVQNDPVAHPGAERQHAERMNSRRWG